MNRYRVKKAGSILLIIGLSLIFFQCRNSRELTYEELNSKVPLAIDSLFDIYFDKYDFFIKNHPDTTIFPRSYEKDKVNWVKAEDPNAGFLPGILWLLYEYSGDGKYMDAATSWTNSLESQQWNQKTYEMGFIINSSFGNAYRILQDSAHLKIIEQSAKTLSKRFNHSVGSIQSLDGLNHYTFPVMIDNLVSNEILLSIWQSSGNADFYNIANSHALNTMEDHYRRDFSCVQIVDYNNHNGKTLSKSNMPGLSDSTSWARGQSWGLYGFCMTYKRTMDRVYLDMAIRIADYILSNKDMPGDLIPYWDYSVSDEAQRQRDASSAVILLSALLDLSSFPEISDPQKYRLAAERILVSLVKLDYVSKVNENNIFIIKHCIGNVYEKKEVDVPLIFADYYFLEALMKYRSLFYLPQD